MNKARTAFFLFFFFLIFGSIQQPQAASMPIAKQLADRQKKNR